MFFGDGTSTVTYKQKAELEIVYIDPGTLRIGDDTMRMAATTARDEYVYTKRTDITSLPTTTWNLYLFRKPTGDSMMYGIYRNLKDGDAEVREYYYP